MTSPVLWTLIAIQIAMGAFDTLYHHELTERLPWRPSQRHELALHAVRNLLYATLFLVLGFFETHGVWALLVIAVLAAEVVITLMDFVEEDLSRKLPASERINHTLLALNYGAILVLLRSGPGRLGGAAGRDRPGHATDTGACSRRWRPSAWSLFGLRDLRRRVARDGLFPATLPRSSRRSPAGSTCWSPARPASSAAAWWRRSPRAGHRGDRAGARPRQGRRRCARRSGW